MIRLLAIAGALLMPSFDGATGWLNSKPLDASALRGRVVLVDFWEYTGVNCLRTLPYEKAWYQRYRKYGFTIVGVHTPEFRISGEADNVKRAVARLGVDWPVALDSNSAIWTRWNNDVWPHEFLVDQSGRIVYDYEGEGGYPDMEAKIQGLLRATNPDVSFPKPMDYLPQDSYDKPGAVCYPHTGELYVGDWHGGDALGNDEGYHADVAAQYADDSTAHQEGKVYLSGPWLDAGQNMVEVETDSAASAYVDVRYRAIDAVAVLAPESKTPVTVYVEQDGKPVAKEDAGADIRYDATGRSSIDVDAAREYDVIRNRHFGAHDLLLRPAGYGLGVYTFDFEACEVGADR